MLLSGVCGYSSLQGEKTELESFFTKDMEGHITTCPAVAGKTKTS
jgi:hypothetical protein